MILKVDLKLFVFLIMYYFTRQIQFFTFVMLFAFVHEMAHLLAGIVLKMKVKQICILPVGFSLQFALSQDDYNKKILKSNQLEIKKLIVAIAGPLINFLIILYTVFSKREVVYKNLILYSNLAILIFNILPIYPLDGRKNIKINFFFDIWKKKCCYIY